MIYGNLVKAVRHLFYDSKLQLGLADIKKKYVVYIDWFLLYHVSTDAFLNAWTSYSINIIING